MGAQGELLSWLEVRARAPGLGSSVLLTSLTLPVRSV
jgi:hypothetical protein